MLMFTYLYMQAYIYGRYKIEDRAHTSDDATYTYMNTGTDTYTHSMDMETHTCMNIHIDV
jgi:hypothetical protein